MTSEIQTKENLLKQFMNENRLDGILFSTREFFSWVTGGKVNHIITSTELGNVDLLITQDRKYCITNKFERYRVMEEELAGLEYEAVEYNWWESNHEDAIKAIVGKGRVGCDTTISVGINVYEQLKELRYSLLPEEVTRYKETALDAATALEETCKNIRRGVTEFEVSGDLQKNSMKRGVEAMGALVISDDRLFKYRHPLPKDKKIDRYVLVVTCGRKCGLITCASRFVHFGEPPKEIIEKHRKVIKIEAEFITNTIPGRKVSDVFNKGVDAYKEAGYENEWQLLHQGGPLGYSVRDYHGTPNVKGIVQNNQAFAWNPSITGTKSEDTIIVNEKGFEIISNTGAWPLVDVKANNGMVLRRPDILIR